MSAKSLGEADSLPAGLGDDVPAAVAGDIELTIGEAALALHQEFLSGGERGGDPAGEEFACLLTVASWEPSARSSV